MPTSEDELPDHLPEALAGLPLRTFSQLMYRASPRSQVDPLHVEPLAVFQGRWHRVGDPQPVYAADTQLVAMLEVVNHTVVEPGEEPILPRRRISELYVRELPTLDLDNDLALDVCGIAPHRLSGDGSSAFCRTLADACWQLHPHAYGLLVPSTPVPGGQILAIRPSGFSHVEVGDQYVVTLTAEPAGDGAGDHDNDSSETTG